MIAGILLAAGESTRMGQLKALLPWQGKALIEAQSQAMLSAGLRPLIVVLGHRADELRPLVPTDSAVRIVLNQRYAEGRSTSIATGAGAVSEPVDAVIIASVDQPLDADVLRTMMTAHGETHAPMVVPSIDHRRGHPALFDASLLPELLAVTEEREGLREVVTLHAGEIHYVNVTNPIVRVNLNSPEDYEAARRVWNVTRTSRRVTQSPSDTTEWRTGEPCRGGQ